jgi:hypothetical protein
MSIFIRFSTILILILTFQLQLLAQNGMLSTGGDGTGSGGTFSYSFGQFAWQTFFQSSSSIAQGVQHPFEISYVPSLLSVLDTTIKASETGCFDALEDITVAGNGHIVIVQNTAEADFIAGNSIRFLPGFSAVSGSLVHGRITTDHNFCDGYFSMSIVQNPPEEKGVEIAGSPKGSDDLSPDLQVKVYPNPNNGQFKIELIRFENRATVSIYNITGAVYYTSALEQTIQNEMNITNLRNGIYFVKVISDNKQFVKKIIVN